MSSRILSNKNVISYGVDNKKFVQTMKNIEKRKDYVQYLADNVETPNRFQRRLFKKFKINK